MPMKDAMNNNKNDNNDINNNNNRNDNQRVHIGVDVFNSAYG